MSMDQYLFNLKARTRVGFCSLIPQMTARQLEKLAKNCEKEEKLERLKLKKRSNMEGARIHAENAIRQKNQSVNYLRMSARVEAVSSRVQTAVSMRQVTGSLKGVVQSMDKAMQAMNLSQMTALMDKFEQQFNDLDVQSSVMEKSMGQSVALTTPVIPNTKVAAAKAEDDDLSQRLARLRDS